MRFSFQCFSFILNNAMCLMNTKLSTFVEKQFKKGIKWNREGNIALTNTNSDIYTYRMNKPK